MHSTMDTQSVEPVCAAEYVVIVYFLLNELIKYFTFLWRRMPVGNWTKIAGMNNGFTIIYILFIFFFMINMYIYILFEIDKSRCGYSNSSIFSRSDEQAFFLFRDIGKRRFYHFRTKLSYTLSFTLFSCLNYKYIYFIKYLIMLPKLIHALKSY